MYDILLSHMSEKEQMEALNTPYKKKKPKARMNEKSLTDVTKNASAEVSVSDEKEKEEEEEGQEEGQEEEEPTVVTYRFSAHAHPVQSLAYYDEDNETTLISGSNDRTVAFWDLEKTSTKKIFQMFCRRQCSSFTLEQKFAQW